jgi:predicted  nucleic acid-binding Zn-ribbon protein
MFHAGHRAILAKVEVKMATIAFATAENEAAEKAIAADGFSALEQKIVRTVELLKSEREARAAAESELAQMRKRVEEEQDNAREIEAELKALRQERDAVRVRVEKLMKQLDALAEA